VQRVVAAAPPVDPPAAFVAPALAPALALALGAECCLDALERCAHSAFALSERLIRHIINPGSFWSW